MNTRQYRKLNLAVENFKSSLLADRSAMDAVRNTMSDASYGKLWGISSTTVVSYMGYTNKGLYNGMPKIKIDVDATNKLRWQYKDSDIAKMLNCSNASIAKYCGTRRDNGIPHISASHIVPDVIPTLPPAIQRKQKEEVVGLKQDRWDTKIEKPYWDTSSEVQLYNGPHKFFYQKLR